jgi:hypothetical protein
VGGVDLQPGVGTDDDRDPRHFALVSLGLMGIATRLRDAEALATPRRDDALALVRDSADGGDA